MDVVEWILARARARGCMRVVVIGGVQYGVLSSVRALIPGVRITTRELRHIIRRHNLPCRVEYVVNRDPYLVCRCDWIQLLRGAH